MSSPGPPLALGTFCARVRPWGRRDTGGKKLLRTSPCPDPKKRRGETASSRPLLGCAVRLGFCLGAPECSTWKNSPALFAQHF
ncbi:hypothetical protein GN956_G19244 [Arapaima gigas]